MGTSINNISVDDVAREQNTSRRWPGFSTPLELLYRLEDASNNHKVVAVSWLIGITLYDMFLISDSFVARDDLNVYLIGRLGLTTPIILALIYKAFRGIEGYHFYTACVPLVATLSLSIMLILSHGAYRQSYLFGDILIMMCGCSINRSRLGYAIATVVLQCMCYAAVVGMSDIISHDTIAVSLLFCGSGGVFGLMSSYSIEQASRRAFLMGCRIRLLNQALESMATTDPLTGLGNRRAFEGVTDRFWAERAAGASWACLILIDVDRFKLFNDNYGHAAGDFALTTIGRCVTGALRNERDAAVRFGGEELIVFLPDTQLAEGLQVAEAIRRAIIAANIPHPALAPDAVVTGSLGVAAALTTECTVAELVIRADIALYTAKNNGRNQVWPPSASGGRADMDLVMASATVKAA